MKQHLNGWNWLSLQSSDSFKLKNKMGCTERWQLKATYVDEDIPKQKIKRREASKKKICMNSTQSVGYCPGSPRCRAVLFLLVFTARQRQLGNGEILGAFYGQINESTNWATGQHQWVERNRYLNEALVVPHEFPESSDPKHMCNNTEALDSRGGERWLRGVSSE